MKALITGITGFTGVHLRYELEENGYDVFGLCEQIGATVQPVDIRDTEKVLSVIKVIKPDVVFHLAAQAIASVSWKKPQETIMINTVGTVNLLEALRTEAPYARVLFVGSADQYGIQNSHCNTISEEMPLNPQTPYGVSKCAQEQLGKIYVAAYGMQICMTRTFSFGGPGQDKGFVLPDFAFGVASVEAGLSKTMCVGNLDSERDFTHIKDVVRAYRLINEQGVAGEVYNVGSGEVHSIRELLQCLLDLASCKVPVISKEAKQRPKDVHGAACNHDKLTCLTGWQPEIPFFAMIEEELEDWRQRIHTEKRTI